MRVTTAFNEMLAIPGATVADVSFTPEGVVVGLRRRAKVLTCPCGFRTRATYDSSIRRWRHLDLGACRLLLESEIRQLECPRCKRVRTRASRQDHHRPAAAHLGEAVANIVMRVVADKIDDSRLDDLYRIGVDEISYRKGHRYLTVVADHETGTARWCGSRRARTTPS
ncbi:MAG: transposase [Actinobacteria bacterium]|nr:transposase [Actinomycetota bacterium]